ncbi:hypothetical protein Taro_008319 [Colocasia esculenta]|uniref:Ubiquitin carboxyl-terminal hydrolase n=1 Tax=Colocasia esculenta TaxID=4460 RepID=A0A843U2R8_COLES|nr:hypothetical protein [Colocasia esculenta]
MAEGAVETSKAPPGEALLQGRIKFHPARRPLPTANASLSRDPRMEALNPSPGSHRPAARSGALSSSMAGRRSDGGEFHQRGLDPELSFDISFRRIGAGLANLGNTCFLNSVLQCLTYTEPFAAYLKSGKHKSSCKSLLYVIFNLVRQMVMAKQLQEYTLEYELGVVCHSAGFCTMCALQTHVMDALQSTGKILRPFHLVKNLRSISRNFRNSRQEDAHEYMVNLLESMHKCCLPSGIASESPSAYEKSLVHKIFGGRLRSQVKCLQCSYCSNKFDPFLDLSLEIMKADSLHKALSHFTAVEQLDGGERQYQCQRCKQKVRAVKQLTIHKAPYVLTVHLKRFGSALPGQKINKKVDFEPTLDLKRYVSDPCEGDLKYTLYGVLVHAGYATHSGHYYCFVRTSSGMWYSLNDDEVSSIKDPSATVSLFSSAVSKHLAAENLIETASSGECCSQYFGKDLVLSIVPKEKTVSSLSGDLIQSASASGTLIVTNSPSEDCRVTLASSHSSQMKDDLSAGSTVDVVLRQARGNIVLHPSSHNPRASYPLVEDITVAHASALHSHVKDGLSTDTTVNVDKLNRLMHHAKGNVILDESDHGRVLIESTMHGKHDAQDMKVQVNSTSCKAHSSPVHGRDTLYNHSSAIGSTDDLRISHIPCQDATVNDERSSGPVVAEVLKSVAKEPGRDQIDCNLSTSSSVQKDGVGCTESYKLDMKGKVRKHAHKRKMIFGPRRLFLAYLNLVKKNVKKKKHRRIKKQHSSIMEKRVHGTLEDSVKGDQGISTSMRFLDVGLVLSTKRKTPESLWRESGIATDADLIYSTKKDNSLGRKSGPCGADTMHTDSINANESYTQKRRVKNGAETISKLGVQHRTGEACAHSNSDHVSRSLLVSKSREMTATRWSDVDSPGVPSISDDEPKSIGYMLNEWEKVCDRGKKKVKRSRVFFGGGNHFRDIAAVRTRKKLKIDQARSENKPFRIRG